MAITTQAQLRTHLVAALKSTISANPTLFLPLIPGFIQYAKTGADQREAIEMLLTTWWAVYAPSVPFSTHRVYHELLNNVVSVADAIAPLQRVEP